ncbi:hypothetical protein chiPu_0004139 [Chiloscyllium punctatum]|uniref:Reverse transcriptase domain-containing protein n=1 Tax=Chiloscyllium punctatum TaxID=137246 RepID=A0A401S5R6_CHIPU|nr:hypothetical protein [Chiloscyllium punctatum]
MIMEKVGPIRDSGGNLCVESGQIEEALNEFFASVFTKESDSVVNENFEELGYSLDQIKIDEVDMWKLLENIKIDESSGSDQIYPRLLREARKEVAKPLARIFASSLSTGVIPEDWKEANVFSRFKSGNREISDNYRPVSLASVVSKVLERILRDRIYDNLAKHSVIKGSQHGFVRGRSCLRNLIEFFEEVLRLVDEG